MNNKMAIADKIMINVDSEMKIFLSKNFCEYAFVIILHCLIKIIAFIQQFCRFLIKFQFVTLKINLIN